MRFAYIDSQGNEVSIPSVDALAIRIELGAIGPDTQLYDAQADRWGPAQSHEIFHTLSRDVLGEEGFVAPPPPVPAPDDAEEDEAEEPAGWLDLAPPEPAPKAPPPVAPADEGLPDFGALSLVDGDEDDEEDSPPPPPPPPKAPAAEAPIFDFGGGLELAPEAGPGASAGSGAMDFSGAGGFGGGMELETAMGGFSPEAPSPWPEPEVPPAFEDAPREVEPERPVRRRTPAIEAAVTASGAAGDGEVVRRERPEPRSRPSPPRRPRKRAWLPVLLGLVGVGAVGGGGYYGWLFLQGRSERAAPAQALPTLPPVTIPDIPAELLPRMRDLGEVALSETIRELGAIQGGMELPAEPNRDWLAGVYLAEATRFPDVKQYWEGMEAFLNRVRDVDTQTFHERYQAQLAAAGMTGDTAAMLLERADSGFLATREDRREAYILTEELIFAALDLHDFLVRNEANIDFDPAAGGVSRDPVLEAVPNTPEIGEEMWARVDRITKALDALGTLDRVTTERLTAVLFDRIRRAGFR